MKSTPANTRSTAKVTDHENPKESKRGSRWPKGKSGNPKGRPKDGESWAGVMKELSNMTTDEIMDLVGRTSAIGKKLKKLPKRVQMKYIVGANAMANLALNINQGLFSTVMDRIEGKPGQSVDLTTKGQAIKTYVGVSPDEWDNESKEEGE
jgi:hypothetical protein